MDKTLTDYQLGLRDGRDEAARLVERLQAERDALAAAGKDLAKTLKIIMQGIMDYANDQGGFSPADWLEQSTEADMAWSAALAPAVEEAHNG